MDQRQPASHALKPSLCASSPNSARRTFCEGSLRLNVAIAHGSTYAHPRSVIMLFSLFCACSSAVMLLVPKPQAVRRVLVAHCLSCTVPHLLLEARTVRGIENSFL